MRSLSNKTANIKYKNPETGRGLGHVTLINFGIPPNYLRNEQS